MRKAHPKTEVPPSNGKTVAPMPRSRTVAMHGIHNSHECAALISALHADLSVGAVTPTVANAHANLVAKTLKLKELEQKYGQPYSPGQKRLQLAPS